MSVTAQDRRADRIAARATGFGIGLMTFMVVWTVGARVTERVLDTPTNAYTAMAIALIAGGITTVRAGRRLDRGAQVAPTDQDRHDATGTHTSRYP